MHGRRHKGHCSRVLDNFAFHAIAAPLRTVLVARKTGATAIGQAHLFALGNNSHDKRDFYPGPLRASATTRAKWILLLSYFLPYCRNRRWASIRLWRSRL